MNDLYSNDSPMYAAESVAKTSACIEPVKMPSNIMGTGKNNGANKHNTDTTISSAKMLPNSRKLSESGFVKSSNMLIGKKNILGKVYRLKKPNPFLLKPA